MGVISISPRAAAVRLVLGTVAALAVTASMAAPAQGSRGEHQVKAVFLYKLVNFVHWPPSAEPSAQLVIGVIGNDFFSNALDYVVRGKSVQGREIVVRLLSADDDLRACDIVFVSGFAARRTADILARAQTPGVLTVGETPEFLREGGLVRFYVEGDRIRVQINAAGADQAGLKISAQLLSLAR